jgi:hypothetical protein
MGIKMGLLHSQKSHMVSLVKLIWVSIFFEAQLIWPPARHRSDGLPYGTQSTS